MRIFKLLSTFAAAILLFSACTPAYKQRTDQAITDVLNEFKAVGIAAAVVKDGKIIYNESFGFKDLEKQTPSSQ